MRQPHIQECTSQEKDGPTEEQDGAAAHGTFGAAVKTTKSTPVAAVREKIILGIDPGTTVMGFGVPLIEGGQVRLLDSGAIRFPADDDDTLKLRAIFRETARIIL
ncbi:MAG TPA: crossover junction endodeoxyribonuclease RuvC, partial [Flavobacteriales bacterium]|nr:crossover junction endodeoxyribonuclease RuvC [Flavobacteriales bacterium]